MFTFPAKEAIVRGDLSESRSCVGLGYTTHWSSVEKLPVHCVTDLAFCIVHWLFTSSLLLLPVFLR